MFYYNNTQFSFSSIVLIINKRFLDVTLATNTVKQGSYIEDRDSYHPIMKRRQVQRIIWNTQEVWKAINSVVGSNIGHISFVARH